MRSGIVIPTWLASIFVAASLSALGWIGKQVYELRADVSTLKAQITYHLDHGKGIALK